MSESTLSTKTFFKEGNWELHDNPLQHERMNPAISRVIHFCDPRDLDPRVTVWFTRFNFRCLSCPHCQETMPESIQTLWTLHNFDVDFERMNTGTGNGNVFIGYNAGKTTTGSSNVCIGKSAGVAK